MAKTQAQTRRGSAASSDPETSTTSRRKAAAAPAKKTSYTVRTHITYGDRDADGVTDVYEVGDTIELTDAEAAKMPWAVEKEGVRRGGQTSRLKRQVEELTAKIRTLEADAKRSKSDDPNLEAAAESLKNRGDNYIARGEPTPGGVPVEAIDAHDRKVLLEDGGVIDTNDEGDDGDDDTANLAGGMRGLDREKTGGPDPAAGTGTGSAT